MPSPRLVIKVANEMKALFAEHTEETLNFYVIPSSAFGEHHILVNIVHRELVRDEVVTTEDVDHRPDDQWFVNSIVPIVTGQFCILGDHPTADQTNGAIGSSSVVKEMILSVLELLDIQYVNVNVFEVQTKEYSNV